ncbi:MAG: type II secretion system F family protein [Candidatus Aenigmatarchaeota archaeon]
MIEKKLLILMIIDATLVSLLLFFNFTILSKIPELALVSSLLTFLSIFILAFPLLLYYYKEYVRLKNIEEYFPIFLRDFVEAVRGGLTVPMAFKSVSRNDYKELTPYIKKISARLEWGLPIDEVLLSFGKEVKSKLISRIVASVVEAHKFGGNIADTFQSLSNVSIEVDRLRKERLAYLQGQIATGYIIFFVFLGVIIGIERFLLPGLSQASATSLSTLSQQNPLDLGIFFKNIFRDLIIIQGIFSGLAIGKMGEGSLVAGIKHSLFMTFIGGITFILFAA